MVSKRKMSGQGVSIPVGIAVGVIVSVAVMLLGALGSGFLVINETVPIDGMGFGAVFVLALAAAANPAGPPPTITRSTVILFFIVGLLYSE